MHAGSSGAMKLAEGSLLVDGTVRNVACVGLYAGLWTAYSLLIKASKGESGAYPYNVFSVILCIELSKLVMATLYVTFFLKRDDGGFALTKNLHLASYFAVPAFIYCVYNYLSFANLRLLEPISYRVLINIRVFFSAVLLQVVFGTRVTARKWFALILLVVGCTLEQLGSFQMQGGALALTLMSVQALCSSLAGVYFQWLLQRKTDVSLWEKNAFLYFWGSVMNFAFMVFLHPELVFSPTQFFHNFDSLIIPIILVGSFAGFSTSLLLQYMDVVAKEYANFVEMLMTAIVSHMMFNSTISVYLMFSILIVTVSVIWYNRAPDAKEKDKDEGSIMTNGMKKDSGANGERTMSDVEIGEITVKSDSSS